MHPAFAAAVELLHTKFQVLVASMPLGPIDPKPMQGVYLFSEGDRHLYVGRSNNIPKRYAGHTGQSATHLSAAFAMLLARAETGRKADYKKGPNTRKELMLDPVFRPSFDAAKARIRAMEFRAVEETDQTRQTLLEVYCAIALATPHNDFGTH